MRCPERTGCVISMDLTGSASVLTGSAWPAGVDDGFEDSLCSANRCSNARAPDSLRDAVMEAAITLSFLPACINGDRQLMRLLILLFIPAPYTDWKHSNLTQHPGNLNNTDIQSGFIQFTQVNDQRRISKEIRRPVYLILQRLFDCRKIIAVQNQNWRKKVLLLNSRTDDDVVIF